VACGGDAMQTAVVQVPSMKNKKAKLQASFKSCVNRDGSPELVLDSCMPMREKNKEKGIIR